MNHYRTDPNNESQVELQFHTPQSFALKQATHELYEVQRTAEDAATAKAASDAMSKMSSSLSTPPGIESISAGKYVSTGGGR